MKFSNLALPPAADDGADLHLRHPAFKHPLYAGDGADDDGRAVEKAKASPVTVKVRSWDSDPVREALKAGQRRAMKGGDEDNSDDLIDALIVSWQGIEGEDGKPWPCTRANKIALMNGNRDVDRQIVAFAQDQANFFGARGDG